MGSLFFYINGWVFKVKSCHANNSVHFSGHQVKILNLKHDIQHLYQWKYLNLQLLLWYLQTVSFSNSITAVSVDQCNCNNCDFSVQLYWFHIENESYHTKIKFELEERKIVYQGQWSWSLLSLKYAFFFPLKKPKRHEKLSVLGSNINF